MAVFRDTARGCAIATLVGLLSSAVLAPACRQRTELCAESACSTPGTGGAAGERDDSVAIVGGDAGGDAGGHSGAQSIDDGGAGAAECGSDRDCDDGLGCSGQEKCEAGHCSGAPPECPTPTRCVEQPNGFSCELEQAANWVVYLGDDLGDPFALLARPLQYLDEEVPAIQLAGTGDLKGAYVIVPVGANAWSPNRRYLALEAINISPRYYTSRLFLAEFGAGLPEPARLMKDVPQNTDLSFRDWSADSTRALVVNHGYQHEGYVVDLQSNTTSLLFADGTDVDFLRFCADSRLVTRSYPDGAYLLDLETGSSSPMAPLLPGAASLSLSPDRRWLWLEDSAGVWTTPCAASGSPALLVARHEEPEEFLDYWSPDSELAALQVYNGDVSVFDADDAFKVIASFQADTYSLSWPRAAHRLAFTRTDEADVVALFSADFSTQSPSPRRLSTAASSVSDVTWVNDELLAYAANAADGTYEAHLVRAVEPFDDRLLIGFPPDVTLRSLKYDPLARYVFFTQQANGLDQVYALSLTSPTAKPHAVFDTPMPPNLTLEDFTSDGSGLVVQYRAPVPQERGSLWWVAFDAHHVERPRAISSGNNAGFATLKPLP